MSRPTPELPQIAEVGRGGATSDRRLFMMFQAWTGVEDVEGLSRRLGETDLPAVLYTDLHDPSGVGLVTYSEAPDDFAGRFREPMRSVFAGAERRAEYSMFGRTYALGYEPDLDEVLIERPKRHLLHGDWRWAIWYPLRRKGGFTQLPADEQREILMEHGKLGMGFGAADYAHDLRLACHGLDPADNDFVIGLVGRDLAPLSKLVERMRGTIQTSTWLERLGPFFVGRKVWQNPASTE